MKAKEKKLDDINVGDSASFEETITDEMMIKFADISGDYNPLHIEGKVVYGMLLGALVSRLVGMELPGKYALLMKECLEFKKPARVGDTLTVKGSVVFKSQASRIIELAIEINKDKELLASGSAHVRVLE
ncbi:MAG: MaoC/PaaZ C-terminal domain-containing protein [Candidatus Azambacteria bacterium]|nr:MaoC/PaaZ C-terminal domain-containing protein [Candidatus Azambacteria bacterium]